MVKEVLMVVVGQQQPRSGQGAIGLCSGDGVDGRVRVRIRVRVRVRRWY
jgi:hypothetical protein